MSKKIEMGKQYRTCDGRNVRILCIDRENKYPVVGLINNVYIAGFTETGRFCEDGYLSHNDLIEYNPAQELKVDQAIWVRDYGNEPWTPRHFAKVTEAGKVACWYQGLTSHSARHDVDEIIIWNQWSITTPNK